jgi:hypothetical protein
MSAAEPESTRVEFAWSAHPARRHCGKAILGAVIILGLAAATWFAMSHWWWGIMAVLVMVAALNRFYFPSRFAVTDAGITAVFPLRRQQLRWSDLRRFVCDAHGGYLSTRTRRSRMDAFTGMHVIFGDQPERAIEVICQHLPHGRSG